MRVRISQFLMLFLAAVVVSRALPASAESQQHASLFGVSLGEPMSIPPCAMFNSKLGYSKPIQGENLCSFAHPPSPNGNQNYDVYFAQAEHPKFVVGTLDFFEVIVRDGIIQEVRVFTDGLRSQSDVLDNLTQKFGKPGVLRNYEAQNIMGAKFATMEAHWIIGADIVSLTGAIRTDAGVIKAQTADQAAFERTNNKDQGGPKL